MGVAGAAAIEVRVEVVEELGSDAFVFVEADAEPIVVEAVSADDEEASLLAARDRPLFGARVDPRTAARVGEPIRLAVDPGRFHSFDRETGESLLARPAAALG